MIASIRQVDISRGIARQEGGAGDTCVGGWSTVAGEIEGAIARDGRDVAPRIYPAEALIELIYYQHRTRRIDERGFRKGELGVGGKIAVAGISGHSVSRNRRDDRVRGRHLADAMISGVGDIHIPTLSHKNAGRGV